MIQRFCTLLLAVVILTGVTACGTDGDSSSTGSETVSGDAASDTPETAAEGNAPVFDFETHTVTLNSGYEMPIYGLGTYSLHGEECKGSVKTAG